MNDPHVDDITYVLEEADDVEYRNPPAVTIDTPAFRGLLSGGVLTLYPKNHFASAEDVIPIAEDFVRAWEIEGGLGHGRPDFRLSYGGCQILDRAPDPGTAALHATSRVGMTASTHLKAIRDEYPTPPSSFVATPEVEVLWERFARYLERKEPLLSMAYFCLTLLERGDRRAAATHYNIHMDVLRKLGELTSTRGDHRTARKLNPAQTPLAHGERVWIEAAITAIIHHIAEGQRSTLTMARLPKV